MTKTTQRKRTMTTNQLLRFAESVARSACLQQFNNDKCICFSCEAQRIIRSAK